MSLRMSLLVLALRALLVTLAVLAVLAVLQAGMLLCGVVPAGAA